MNHPTTAELSTKLVELESHPGLEHLRRYPPSGVTARRWAVIERALLQLWNDVGALTTLTDRGGIADGVARIDASYAEVKEFLDAVAEVNTTVAMLIAPSLKQIDGLGMAMPADVTDLLAVSASDPLSLTFDNIHQRATAITELVALLVNWPAAVADTALQLDALQEAIRHAGQTRERATRQVLAGPLPVCVDQEPELRAELESLSTPDPAALTTLRARVESALCAVRRDEAMAQGLLDRRAELKGRLRVYEAKAARLGLAEDKDLMSSRRVAVGLLSRRPCDLRAVTQAVVDYQQLVSHKRGGCDELR